MGMKPYVVRQGDYLAKLAHVLGFDADAIWNHAKNRELREARPNPNILAPGDILFVPDTAVEGLAVTPHQSNRFKARVPTVKIDLTLNGPGKSGGDSPFANEAYVVEGLGERREGRADGNGRVQLDVPATATEVHLVFARLGVSMPVRVGHLDPVEQESGVRQRLDHLGHEGLELGEAIRAFQKAQGLTETGAMNDETRGKLREAHGA